MDLVVRPGPGVPDGLVIPEDELVERFSRSSGPGGQSVNTTDSRVELVFDAGSSRVLDERQRRRLAGVPLVATASEHRSQHRNRLAVRERLGDLVRDALAPPPLPRVPTKPTRGSQRRRVDTKKRRGRTKALRGRVRDD